MLLSESLSKFWGGIQRCLFPFLEEEMGELSANHRKLVATLEMIRIESFVGDRYFKGPGRPPKDRAVVVRAFVAKAVYNLNTTRALLDRLASDPVLRRLCGWDARHEIPSEATFSRAFAEFARSELPQRVHEALVKKHLSEEVIGHIARDATEIEVREKPEKKTRKSDTAQAPSPKRLERQKSMMLKEMLDELPRRCDVGMKTNSKGYREVWVGYKLHLDVADGQIPISCILTSASLHDSQAALPLMEMTRERVINLYDLMDSAYDAKIIREGSESLGHKPIIDTYNRGFSKVKDEREAEYKRLELLHFELPEQRRFKNRTAVERVYGRLKDEFGGETVRVRGAAKVMAHLMFGILVLTADQLLRLVT